MARNQNKTYYKRFYAQVSLKKNEKPCFKMSRKEPADYVLQRNEVRDGEKVLYNETGLSGMLVSMKSTGYTWEEKNKYIETIEMTLRDHEAREDYVIQTSYNQVCLGIINGLLNVESFDLIDISLYEDKEGFNKVSIKWRHPESGKVDWAGFNIPYQEYKDLIRKYEGKGGMIESDWTKCFEFFRKKLEEVLIPRVKEYVQNADVECRENDVRSYPKQSQMETRPVQQPTRSASLVEKAVEGQNKLDEPSMEQEQPSVEELF